MRTAEHMVSGVGRDARRVDGVPKVRGEFAYGSDLWADGMLWGHTVRSPHPHALIRSIDVAPAIGRVGVHAVLLAEDLPGRRTFGIEFSDQPVLARERVRCVGEPVAIVAAEHPEIARRAAGLVRVEYEPLPAVLDMEDALQPDAAQVREFGNIVRHVRIVHGDPDVAADIQIDGYYETGMQDQAALGLEAGLAIPAEDGGVDLYVPSQWVHIDRRQIAPCLNLPEEKVRVHLAGVGGAFGSREDLSMHIHACLLALRTGRPVKMTYGREESFFGHPHRHPARIWMGHAATRDGKLVSVRARLVLDGGPYTSTSPAVGLVASTFACGPYDVPNALIEGSVVYTNNPVCGAMRGFGAVQACFAYEAQMDRLARALAMDPVDLRLRNALTTGSVLPTGQVVTGTAPVAELIRRCAAIPLPVVADPGVRDRSSLPGGAGNVGRGERVQRGVGFAVGLKNISYSGGADDYSEATIELSAGPAGPEAEIRCAASEVGQGVHTVLVQIARTELGVDRVVLLPPDTSVGSSGPSSASRQTMMSGGAVQVACRAVLDELFERARNVLTLRGDPPRAPFSVADGELLVGGVSVGSVVDFLGSPIRASRTYHHRRTQPVDENGQGDVHVTFAFAAQRAVVDVDLDLGLARVVQVASVQDVGRAINPQGVHGQVEGGIAQGLGLALMEELVVHEGTIRNASFTDYLIPTIMDVPDVISELYEEPEPGLPFGAKGAAEHPTIAAPAAIASALRSATSRGLNRIPIRPDDLIGITPSPVERPPPPPPVVPGPKPIAEYAGLKSSREVPIGSSSGSNDAHDLGVLD
jgi:xanthine dehydrogenase D subunit